MIILIGGEKGGTGKTTIATNLAAIRANKEHTILLIDMDKQQSATAWANVRDTTRPNVKVANIQLFGTYVSESILDLKPKYEDIIIDAAGRDEAELRAAMVIADKMYIPSLPSQLDIWSLSQMNALAQVAKGFNPTLVPKILISRASTNPSVKETEEAKETTKDYEYLDLSACTLKERVAYRKAVKAGFAVTELTELDIKAFDEIMALYNEVFNGNQ